MHVSDNFYNLYLNEEDIYLYLAILNSVFTKISILLNSRNQGNGLFKIQLFEFEKGKIFNEERLSENTRNKLQKLGKELSSSLRRFNEKIVKEIDHILLSEYNRESEKNLDISDLYEFQEVILNE